MMHASWLVVMVSLVAGWLGAAAAEFLALTLPTRGDERRGGRYIRMSIAGAMAAGASISWLVVKQPWAGVAGGAALISACADAIFLARQWRGRAHAAEWERDHATEQLQVATRTFVAQIEGLRQAVFAAHAADFRQRDPQLDRTDVHDTMNFERAVNNAFSMARRATAAAGETPSLWDQVRAILTRRLGRTDVDDATLAEIGGADLEVRSQIARDIANQWPNLVPTWSPEAVVPESTLPSLVDEIDRRTP